MGVTANPAVRVRTPTSRTSSAPMRFQIKAVNAKSEVLALRIDAATEALARDLARQQGYSVLAVARGAFELGRVFSPRESFDTALFSIELLALLDAGLNLVEALQTLSEKDSAAERRHVLDQVLASLSGGESLSQALARLPDYFPALYVETIRSCERTGNLREALARYIAYQEEFDKVRRKLVAVSIYPAILLAVGSLVLAFLIFFVVPRFARVYEDVAIELPFFSSVLLTVGHGVQSHGGLILAGFSGLIAAAAYAASLDTVRTRVAERLWRLPALGERMRTYQLARLYRTIGMLLRAGLPVVRTFDMVSGLLAAHLRSALRRAQALLEEGKPISLALASAGLTTPLATRMLRVGEESGRLGEMMERIARFLDDETARYLDAFMRVFEPILMTILGLAVGLVVVLMYLPIFELVGSVQ